MVARCAGAEACTLVGVTAGSNYITFTDAWTKALPAGTVITFTQSRFKELTEIRSGQYLYATAAGVELRDAPGGTPAADSIVETQLAPAVRAKLNAVGGAGGSPAITFAQAKNYQGQLVAHPHNNAYVPLNLQYIVTDLYPAAGGASVYRPGAGSFEAQVAGLYEGTIFVGFAGGQLAASDSFNIAFVDSNNTTSIIPGASLWFGVNPAHPEGAVNPKFFLTAGQQVSAALLIEGNGSDVAMIAVASLRLVSAT